MRTSLSALLIVVVTGCASSATDVIPATGPTMLQIYQEHQFRNGAPGTGEASAPMARPQRYAPDAYPALRTGWRIEEDALTQQFDRIPNPDLVMYVFPHLSGAGTPVPGYVTVFPMYERVEYALPGEVSPRERRLQQGERF